MWSAECDRHNTNSSDSRQGPLASTALDNIHRLNNRPFYGLSAIFRVSANAATAPGAPTGLTALARGQNRIDLS